MRTDSLALHSSTGAGTQGVLGTYREELDFLASVQRLEGRLSPRGAGRVRCSFVETSRLLACRDWQPPYLSSTNLANTGHPAPPNLRAHLNCLQCFVLFLLFVCLFVLPGLPESDLGSPVSGASMSFIQLLIECNGKIPEKSF